jgi:hypothetical protein
MNKISVAALGGMLLVTLPFLAACPEGSRPSGPSTSCEVLGRSTNSAGEPYIMLDCNDEDGNLDGQTDITPLLPAIDSYPKCNVTTFWPACQDA